MQALIDFEGWRKWRGFMDSPRSSSPGFDNAASPMQSGSRHGSVSQTQPSSPLITRTTSKSARHKLQRHNLPDTEEILREDSWGSGSGGDTADSTSPPVPPNSSTPAAESSESASPSEQ
jgi:osomolarity two-component system response regulator SSK1